MDEKRVPKIRKKKPKQIILVQQLKIKKKRDPKNYSEIGTTYAYHYYIKDNHVKPLGGTPKNVAEILEVIATKFRGKCITTNIVGQEFSTLKSNIKFR
ncbi:MAG: hypothetical protein ACTSQO_14700 [Candidatus Helarchaeota archaeon]